MSQTKTSPDTTSDQTSTTAGRLLLVDGHSMAFRAFYALPVDSFTTSTGQATNAVHGFTSMLLSLLGSEAPTHLAVAFDLPGGTFRTEEYPEYKGTRDETPEPFKGQVELIQEVLAAMSVPTVTASGYEADDILATLARQGQQGGMEVLVCSGDRDSFQLVTDTCTVLYPVKGVSTLRRMTPEEVQERYGVAPERYPHLAALVGESSDNLPGVPGVGPKTAAKWLARYDGLEGVLAHAADIKGKAGQSLRDHLEDVRRNRRLNALLTDLDLGLDPARDLARAKADRRALQEVFETLEFRSLGQRAAKVLTFSDLDDQAGGGVREADPVAERLSRLEVAVLGRQVPEGGLRDWLADTLGWGAPQRASGVVGLDVAGPCRPGAGGATTIALSDGTHALVADATGICDQDRQTLNELLAAASPQKVVTEAKAAWHRLRGSGIDLDLTGFDPALAGYLCRPEQRGYDVAALAQRWLGLDLDSLGGQEQAGGSQAAFDLEALSQDALPAEMMACARRAAVQTALKEVLTAQMRRRQVGRLFPLETAVSGVLAQMEDCGIAVDLEVLEALDQDLGARVSQAQQEAFEAAGHELNLSSPKQLQTVLFDELGMPKTRRTKTGYTTDAGALSDLLAKTGHPFLASLLEHRDAIKLRQTVEGLSREVQADGRVRTTFQQTVTATGRLSSTDPNLQNIPARTQEGMRIREAFTVGPGYECLLTADYSQIEMRIMAHLSGDQALVGAFRSGEDMHRYAAALVHDIEISQVTAEQRSQVKAMSYGLVYGLSAYGLSKQLGIPTPEAATLQERYFERFGRVKHYLDTVVEQARQDGYTETMLGRRRYLPDLASDNRQRREMAERAALNAPIQGSAADIMKTAMVQVHQALMGEGLASRVLLQIHDELVVEVAPGEQEAVEALLRSRMGGAAELSVPLEVSVGQGRTWRQAAH